MLERARKARRIQEKLKKKQLAKDAKKAAKGIRSVFTPDTEMVSRKAAREQRKNEAKASKTSAEAVKEGEKRQLEDEAVAAMDVGIDEEADEAAVCLVAFIEPENTSKAAEARAKQRKLTKAKEAKDLLEKLEKEDRRRRSPWPYRTRWETWLIKASKKSVVGQRKARIQVTGRRRRKRRSSFN